MRAIRSIMAGTFATALLCGHANADDIPPCAVPKGVAVVAPLSAAPQALQTALRDNIGELVAPGQPFDATDVVTTGKYRRLIFVSHAGARWIVATEHGGIGYNDPIFAYELGADGARASLVETKSAIPDTVCATAAGMVGAKKM